MRGIFSALFWAIMWFGLIVISVGLAIVPFAAAIFLIFAGSNGREKKAVNQFNSTLMREERVISLALQMRIFALWHRRLLIGVTSSRIIITTRGLLGGFTMKDIQWKDLTDARLEQNILPGLCGSNVVFKHSNGGVGLLEMLGIDHDRAAEIYAYAQEEEQAWEEKRRVRGMEESRAASGGVYVNTAPVGNPSSAPTPLLAAQPAPQNRMVEEIQRAKGLLDSGIISDSEFQEMKSKIISST